MPIVREPTFAAVVIDLGRLHSKSMEGVLKRLERALA